MNSTERSSTGDQNVHARVKKRTLHVYTGGKFASSVSLPVPRGHGDDLGSGALAGVDRQSRRARGAEDDRKGARNNGEIALAS